ncbi:hypothetical protein [Reinekea marinisedimentorum]|uniref:Kdo-III transferase WaaZ n=1 Tax=Reinekea marinisedimentorum TaxID=230495 RepID=A0A4R3I6Z2_9GAMM|nr:hypothetical protein [Reinekea marinisedimentorum]TCS41915.1 Kdo-III transferase WaaZ [Reinekea marinisedimentorum]
MKRKRYRSFNLYIRLYRILYRLFLSKEWDHLRKSVPFFKLDKSSCKVRWKGKDVLGLESWDALYISSEKLVVVGSGPSLKRHREHLKLFGPNVTYALVNDAAALIGSDVPAEEAIVIIEDDRFLLKKYDILRDLPNDTRLILSLSALYALCFIDAENASRFRIWFMDGAASPFDTGRYSRSEMAGISELVVTDDACLSKNLELGHFGCGTVAYAGIQLGFLRRTKQVYLVGVDMTNFNLPRFNENDTNAAWTGLARSYQSRILPAFTLASEVAKQEGMTIFNCSDDSIIPRDIFPYCPLLADAAKSAGSSGD